MIAPTATPAPNFNAMQIHKLHVTSANALNLAKKTAKIKEQAILERDDLANLPARGQKLVDRLKIIRVKKSANRAKRDRELKQIRWWKVVQVVATVVGVILGVLIPIVGNFLISSIDADTMLQHVIPGGILLSGAVFNHYKADRDTTEAKTEYHERKHGLDNERAAILVELEPLLNPN